MEAKEGGNSGGVTVVGSDAPNEYHLAPRNENNVGAIIVSGAQLAGTTPAPATQMGLQTPVTSMKKKRGRPRKYGPDGAVTVALSAKPISASAPAQANVIDFSSEKRPKMKPAAPVIKQHQPKFESDSHGEWVSCSVGANFTPHIITVNAGEDVTMKVISFSQQGPRAICILSANGVISSVTLRQPDSSGGTLTYEGRFEILSLTGSFMPSESGGIRNRSGGMSVSLASPDGRVVGGGVAGLLVAASPVQIVVGSFLAGNQHEQKPKKQKSEYIISGSTVQFSNTGMQDSYGGQSQGYHASGTTYSSFHGDTRNGSADHNESLHEG
ncbi:AT-hook motif nuclear-localized protein 1 [Beta vulgaris subsp. vulgaris]|uniref:AT-hook motif nuclear-localized protein 1 n=1 Tax=Beta vulgaris subsp. vulgaris TaxID=3555 RepID=UPI002037095B|nr:AT-hook motif nuclear-localized protein 1 [Beta vulgaris subsp. vulgaris]